MTSVLNEGDTFKCRRCRTELFTLADLSENHRVLSSCSLWFLREECSINWVEEAINLAGWTQGKLYCPQCEARIGAFDFLHPVKCECQEFTTPAVYFVKSKVDHNRVVQLSNIVSNSGKDSDINSNEDSDRMDGDKNSVNGNKDHTSEFSESPVTSNSNANKESMEYSSKIEAIGNDVNDDVESVENTEEYGSSLEYSNEIDMNVQVSTIIDNDVVNIDIHDQHEKSKQSESSSIHLPEVVEHPFDQVEGVYEPPACALVGTISPDLQSLTVDEEQDTRFTGSFEVLSDDCLDIVEDHFSDNGDDASSVHDASNVHEVLNDLDASSVHDAPTVHDVSSGEIWSECAHSRANEDILIINSDDCNAKQDLVQDSHISGQLNCELGELPQADLTRCDKTNPSSLNNIASCEVEEFYNPRIGESNHSASLEELVRNEQETAAEITSTASNLTTDYDAIRMFNQVSPPAPPVGVRSERHTIPLRPRDHACKQKSYFRSHRNVPHVINCQTCQTAYRNYVCRSTRQPRPPLNDDEYYENEDSSTFQEASFQEDDFVNISYDQSSTERNRARDWSVEDNLMASTSFSDSMEIRYANVNRHPLCNCIYLDESRQHHAGHRIQDELRQVQQELINLQGMIQNDLFDENGSIDDMHHMRVQGGNNVVRYTNLMCTIHPLRHSSPRATRRRLRSDTVESFEANQSNQQRELEDFDASDVHIPDHFQCSVCLDLLYDPHETVCHHIFCSPCLKQLHKSSQRRPLCPLCRHRVISVQPCEELHSDIKRLYPQLYRQRSLTESRRPVRNWQLPTTQNTRFAPIDSQETQSALVRAFRIVRATLVVLFLLISYLLSGEARPEHRRTARNVRFVFYALIGLFVLFVIGSIGVLFAYYAFDLFRFIVIVVMFYFAVSLLLKHIMGVEIEYT